MDIIKAFTDSVSSTLADQWKEIITAKNFDEHMVVVPGYLKSNTGKTINFHGSEGVISNGSLIFVPENTAAVIFDQEEIENIIAVPGSYQYEEGEVSIFNGENTSEAIFKQAVNRIGFGGVSPYQKRIVFINLREIRDIKFGTRGPQIYNDNFYGCDLEIYAYGSFTIKIIDPEKFIRNFVPANITYYSMDNKNVRAQIYSDFMQSFIVSLNELSKIYRISEVPAHANEITEKILADDINAGTWKDRFGFGITHVSIENIEFSQESRELVNKYNENKMSVKAYEEVSQKASDISAQQKIASGVEKHGFGDGSGTILGMNIVRDLDIPNSVSGKMTLDEQIDALKKLKELVDMGILSAEEFEKKKKEIMGL